MRCHSALLFTLTCASLNWGCAPVYRTVQYTSAGAADPAGDAELKESFDAERAEPLPADAESITVLIDTVPEGVALENGVLAIEDGYQHEILGKFALTPDGKLFFPAYKQGWRKGVCYWQQPLVIGTLFIWGMIPTYYPCYVTGAISKAEMVDALKRVAYAAGGDLVIATYVFSNQDKTTAAEGFVLRADPRMVAGEGGLGLSGEEESEAGDEEAEESEDAEESEEGEEEAEE
jgi:hypothetical protein